MRRWFRFACIVGLIGGSYWLAFGLYLFIPVDSELERLFESRRPQFEEVARFLRSHQAYGEITPSSGAREQIAQRDSSNSAEKVQEILARLGVKRAWAYPEGDVYFELYNWNRTSKGVVFISSRADVPAADISQTLDDLGAIIRKKGNRIEGSFEYRHFEGNWYAYLLFN